MKADENTMFLPSNEFLSSVFAGRLVDPWSYAAHEGRTVCVVVVSDV